MADKPSKGLADIIAASTALSDIDGRAGLLFYRGCDIHQLAGSATFEEIAYLLQRGRPPTRSELAGYAGEIDAGRAPGSLVTACLPDVAGAQAPMEEQHADSRLIRPESEYVGERGLTWTPLDRR